MICLLCSPARGVGMKLMGLCGVARSLVPSDMHGGVYDMHVVWPGAWCCLCYAACAVQSVSLAQELKQRRAHLKAKLSLVQQEMEYYASATHGPDPALHQVSRAGWLWGMFSSGGGVGLGHRLGLGLGLGLGCG